MDEEKALKGKTEQEEAEYTYEQYLAAYRQNPDHPGRILLSLLRGHGGRLFLTAIFLVLKESPVWVVPILTSDIIDVATNPAARGYSEIVADAGIAFVFILQNIASSYIEVRLFSKIIRNIEKNLRGTLIRRLQHLSISFHKEMASGRILSKVMRDVENIEMLLYTSFGSIFNIIMDTAIALVIILIKSPVVLLFFLVVIPFAVFAVYSFRKPIRRNNTQYRRDVEETQAAVAEMVEMIPVTKAHGLEQTEIDKMDRRLGRISLTGYRLDQINMLFGATSWVIFQAFQVLCLCFTSTLCYHGKISVGEVVLYQNYFAQMVNQLATLINLYPNITKGIESVRSIGEIIDAKDIEPNNAIVPLNQLKGQISFQDVAFHYPDAESSEDIIHDFSLDVPAGTSVAFVGGSGSGKSTLLNLLIGFYQPTGGRILIDRINMKNLDMHEYRSQIAVVPQNTILFSGTIRDNIAYGNENITDADIREVLRKVGLWDVIEKMPDGLDTELGEHGDTLSGGQRQRISIARALLRKPKIIIFDEATSALDSESEKLVQKATDEMMHSCTTFMVAHRLSTIQGADMICVIRDGTIVEKGNYRELMEKKGEFYHLKMLQS
jgi:ATP-binding cassette subfamily B protein